MEIATKVCYMCGDTKVLGEFYRSKFGKFGVSPYC